MNIKKNGKVIRLTESDLKKIVKRVLSEQDESTYTPPTFWDDFTSGANYIWKDIKKAAGETSEIPNSFAKLGDFLTDKKNWEQVGKGFEAAGTGLSNAAGEVADWVTGMFNEQEEKSNIDKLVNKIKDPKKRRMAKKWLRQMGSILKKLKK